MAFAYSSFARGSEPASTNLLARSKYLVASAIAPFSCAPPSAARAGVSNTVASAIKIRNRSIALFIFPLFRLQLIQGRLRALGDGIIGKLLQQLLQPRPPLFLLPHRQLAQAETIQRLVLVLVFRPAPQQLLETVRGLPVFAALAKSKTQRKHRLVRVPVLILFIVLDDVAQMRLRQILPPFLHIRLRHLPIRLHVRRALHGQPPRLAERQLAALRLLQLGQQLLLPDQPRHARHFVSRAVQQQNRRRAAHVQLAGVVP